MYCNLSMVVLIASCQCWHLCGVAPRLMQSSLSFILVSGLFYVLEFAPQRVAMTVLRRMHSWLVDAYQHQVIQLLYLPMDLLVRIILVPVKLKRRIEKGIEGNARKGAAAEDVIWMTVAEVEIETMSISVSELEVEVGRRHLRGNWIVRALIHRTGDCSLVG